MALVTIVTNAIDTGFILGYSVDLKFLGVKLEMPYFFTDKL